VPEQYGTVRQLIFMTLYQIYKENEFDSKAKYIQLAKAIKRSIEKGELKKNDRLPSISDLRRNLNLGKETVLKAFDLLKDEGVIISVQGKGFFVEKTRLSKEFRLFVLFDEFSAYKKELYHSILKGLKGKGEVQFFFHHYNPKIFNDLIIENKGNFTHYIIMPFPNKQITESLDLLPRDKFYILDRNEVLPEGVPAVFQDQEQDVYDSFLSIKKQLKKYEQIILVYPSHLDHPASIVRGFERICADINFKVVDKVSSSQIKKGQAWFVIEDNDLVEVVEIIQNRQWKIGKDLGVISYNDTPMKGIAAGGITTLSADFSEMGQKIMKMIISGKDSKQRCVGKIIDRGSI